MPRLINNFKNNKYEASAYVPSIIYSEQQQNYAPVPKRFSLITLAKRVFIVCALGPDAAHITNASRCYCDALCQSYYIAIARLIYLNTYTHISCRYSLHGYKSCVPSYVLLRCISITIHNSFFLGLAKVAAQAIKRKND